METIRQILDHKGKVIHYVSPETTVYDALLLMADKNIGAVLVLNEGKLFGIMSERDYARKIALKGKFSKEVPVKEIMSNEVFVINIDQSIEDAKAIMINKRIRHLPVMANEKLEGIISIGDVVNAVMAKNDMMIDQLITYIKGCPETQVEKK
ncbi:CBS domain-containing protein [bacterium BMS3Abin03]|jgi:CBS domain-containing protein|nr:CBS domain-containing protein [bacterium BMS3Abin03]MCG6960821.1 CBS domain-containing protein [bacterium BMS3Abin03]